MSEKKENKLSTFMAFIAGGLIGTGVTLLLAPLSNRRTREKIEKKVEDTLTQAQEAIKKATEIEHEVKELIDSSQRVVSEAQSGLQASIKAGKDAFLKKKAESLKEES